METRLTTQCNTSSLVSKLQHRRAVAERADSASPEIIKLRERYPSVKNLLLEFPTTIQDELLEAGADYDFLAQEEDVPTLGMMARAYGVGNANVFVLAHLQFVNMFVGAKEKMQPFQIENLARTIVSEYGFLNVAELCFFFGMFRLGKFGQLYGSVDPLKITSGLNQYVLERNRAIERNNLKRNAERWAFDFDESVRKSATHESYVELLEKGANGDKDALEELRLSQEECESLLTYKKNRRTRIL